MLIAILFLWLGHVARATWIASLSFKVHARSSRIGERRNRPKPGWHNAAELHDIGVVRNENAPILRDGAVRAREHANVHIVLHSSRRTQGWTGMQASEQQQQEQDTHCTHSCACPAPSPRIWVVVLWCSQPQTTMVSTSDQQAGSPDGTKAWEQRRLTICGWTPWRVEHPERTAHSTASGPAGHAQRAQ